MNRCEWVSKEGDLYKDYHDNEWGVPVHNDRLFFEMLILDGAQAGLSWLTVLKKRDNYRKAFDNFDVIKVSKYNESKIKELLNNSGIIRNKLKINSTIKNAKVFIEIQKEFKSFDKYIWNFVNNKPIQNNIKKMKDIPNSTELSDSISINLKNKGMSFVGTTIIYAFLQAAGLVNDHEESCFRYNKLN
jgi:DNA-3-methyladenine glycosylase I